MVFDYSLRQAEKKKAEETFLSLWKNV